MKKASVAKRPHIAVPTSKVRFITYAREMGVDSFINRIAQATPIELIDVEQRGIDSAFLEDLSRHMNIPAVRMFDMVGISRGMAERKLAANAMIVGASGQTAIRLARLLATAKEIVAESTAAEAEHFDTAQWLGRWIEIPQPTLGGRKPADLIRAPTGLGIVVKMLGSIESGVYL